MQEMLFKDISHLAAEEMSFKQFLIYSSGSPFAQQSNIGKIYHKKQFCGVISNLD